jgi:zinc protease
MIFTLRLLKMKKTFLLLFFTLLISSCMKINKQDDDKILNQEKLPLNIDIKRGELSNGLQYIILPNSKPMNQVSLKLIVKAGSLHEQDDQKGIAHLVEHMAFNGTEKYPNNTIIERQEALGMVFGKDVNASTSFSTTSYFLNLPNNEDEVIDEAFNMLAQQVSALTFNQEELEKERPVVEEEWRRTLGMRARLNKAKDSIIKANSRYIERLPIGDMALVRHVDASRIKAFWQDWYHPNNMVLIVVGATNEKQIKPLLEKYFKKIPMVELPALPSTDIPLKEGLSFDIVSDGELNTETIAINFKSEQSKVTTISQLKQQLIGDISTRILSERLRNQYKSGSKNISNMVISSYELAPEYNNMLIMSILKNENYDLVIKEMFLEISRYATHGFFAKDLDPIKRALTNSYKTLLEAETSTTNSTLMWRLSNQVRRELRLTSFNGKIKIVLGLLTEITIDDINQHFSQLVLNRLPMIIAEVKPENKTKQPNINDIRLMWDQALLHPPAEILGVTVNRPLFTQTLPTVDITAHKMQGDIHVWTLKNGAEVWFQPSDKLPDSLLIHWQNDGGTEYLPKEQKRAAQLAVRYMTRFGYGGFDAAQLDLLNAGKSINLMQSVSELQHRISGNSTKDSFDVWLQNFYLQLTMPQIDKKIWEAKKQAMVRSLEGANKSPMQKFSTQLQGALYPENSILLKPTTEEISPIAADDLLNSWKNIFQNSGNSQLFIIGNAEPEWVIKHAARYVGNLSKGKAKADKLLPKLVPYPKKISVHAGKEPKATTQIFWVIDQYYSQATKREAGLLSQIVNLRMRKQLREKAAGVYTSRFSISLDRTRKQLIALLSYSHKPERSAELKAMALKVIDDVLKQGITLQELDIVKKQMQNTLKSENIRDRQKLSWMVEFERTGEYEQMPQHYLTWLEKITPQQLVRIPQLLFLSPPKIEASLLPESI